MILEIEQQTDEWFEARLGIITASNFASIMANSVKSGEFKYDAPFGDPAKKYAMRKALEKTTGKMIETYSNANMERGNELEPFARGFYQDITFNEVRNGAFAVNDGVGASSDGLIGTDGGIEIKSVLYNTHFDTIEKQSHYPKYKWQIQGNIWLYELDWVDFVSYCPDFPEEKQIYIDRVHRDELMIEQLKQRIEHFKTLIYKYEKYLQ